MRLRWIDQESLFRSESEIREHKEKLYASVRERYASELERAGFVRRIILRYRISVEYSKELNREVPIIPGTEQYHLDIEIDDDIFSRFPRFATTFFLLWYSVGLVACQVNASILVRVIGVGLLTSWIGYNVYKIYMLSFSARSRILRRKNEIYKLYLLREEGTITEDEFNRMMKELSDPEG